MARYDRSGRMNYEQFDLAPKEGISDPLQLYFNSVGGFLGGGLTSFKFLTIDPTIVELDLNEWTTLDQPGMYRLGVTSRRVSDSKGSDTFRSGIELKSNVIELEIVATDATWQKDELKRFSTQLIKLDRRCVKFPIRVMI